MRRCLIVEPDPRLRHAMGEALTEAGFEVSEEPAAATAASVAKSLLPDVIILGVAPPSAQEFGVLSTLRSLKKLPAIIAVGKEEPDDVIALAVLAVGADMYMALPVSLPELVGRARCLLGRR